MLRASGVDRVLGRHGRELVENGKMEKKKRRERRNCDLVVFVVYFFSSSSLSPFFLPSSPP